MEPQAAADVTCEIEAADDASLFDLDNFLSEVFSELPCSADPVLDVGMLSI